MTKEEAVQAFREQVPVIVKRDLAHGVVNDIKCGRIAAIEYHIDEQGQRHFTVKSKDAYANCWYSTGPEGVTRA